MLLLRQQCSAVGCPMLEVRAQSICGLSSARPCKHLPGHNPRTRRHSRGKGRAALPPLRLQASSAAGSLSAEGLAEPQQPVHTSIPRALATAKAYLFYSCSLAIAVPLFVVMLAISPLVLAIDRHRRLAEHFVNNLWARLSTLLFYRVTIEGREHLPDPKQPAVYVSNHQSFLDIFTMFHLGRPFKFVSKTSIFFIPIVGWSMWLTGHVPLRRLDRRSQVACLGKCQDLLRKGASVLFFPEGTRSLTSKMAPFKKGAFSVAAKAKVPVVPITLVGTGNIMPSQQEHKMYPGDVKLVIHPLVQPKAADAMLTEAQDAITSAMPAHLRQNSTSPSDRRDS